MNNLALYSLKQLRVDGRELAGHVKREAGPWISDMLNRLLVEAAAGRVSNDKEPLLQLASKWNEEDANHEK
ncbi:CCA-adding enzyme [compost metagenome]